MINGWNTLIIIMNINRQNEYLEEKALITLFIMTLRMINT